MSGLIGKKIGMTSVFGADGKNIPCTVIEAGPCVVTQLKTPEKDGYSAVQIAYDETTEKHTSIGFLSSTIRTKTSLTVCSTDADQTNLLSDVKMISHPIDPIILLQ